MSHIGIPFATVKYILHWYFNIFTRDGNFTDVDFLYTCNLHVLCDFYQVKMVTVVAQNLLKT